MKRIIVATLSMATLSTLFGLPALALNDRFDSERQQILNK
jgi:hypothetical protein